MNSQKIIEMTDENIIGNYGRFPVAAVSGRGAYLYDAEGKEYLDFLSGISVCNLGHCHPGVTKMIKEQADKLVHTSNFFYTEPPARLAEMLVRHSFADRAFFCNSGAEANEAAIKLARKHGNQRGGGRYEIITALKSFHGRTLGTIAATGQEKVRHGFGPHLEGFVHVDPFDIGAVEKAVGPKTGAVMVEPIIGEGGVLFPPDDFLPSLRELCDDKGLLLIYDEIQSGMGRSGKLFAYENWGAAPDIMTLSKALGGGMPIGAVLTTAEIAELFGPGSHGTTFGANPVCTAAAFAVMTEMTAPGFFKSVNEQAQRLRDALDEKLKNDDRVSAIRNLGMFFAIELNVAGKPIVDAALAEGLIINCVQEKTLRIYPPLNVTPQQVDQGAKLLASAFEEAAA